MAFGIFVSLRIQIYVPCSHAIDLNASKDWTGSIVPILHMANFIPGEASGSRKLYSSLIAEFSKKTFILALTRPE